MNRVLFPVLALFLAFPAWGDRSELRVQVLGIRDADGTVRGALWKTPDGFPLETDKSAAQVIMATEPDALTLVFEDVAPGRYSISLFHDRNDNGELDRNFLGIPREAVGVSNDAIGLTGPRSFEEATFDVTAGTNEISIELYHW